MGCVRILFNTIFSVLSASLILGGCFSPAFDEGVALASLSKPDLTFLHSVSTSRLTVPENHMHYFPNPSNVGGGFLLVEIEEFPKLYFLQNSSLKGPIEGEGTISTLQGLEFANGMVFADDPTVPKLILYFPSNSDPSTSETDILLFSYDSTADTLQGPITNQKFLSDMAVPLYFNGIDPTITAGDLHLLGLQLRASSTGSEVYMDAFILHTPSNRYYELSFRMDGSGSVVFDSNLVADRGISADYLEFSGTVPFLDSTVGRYSYSPVTKTSYFQLYQDGVYRTYSWDSEGEPRELDLTGRISSVLSSGDLVCVREGYGRVYQPGGETEFSFGLGTLSLIYELYPDGIPTLFFVESIDQREEGGHLFYETYTLPTADLSKMEN
ncbi:MAG: hypothetical protein Kow009_14590 [Spirochaetales bacterium]